MTNAEQAWVWIGANRALTSRKKNRLLKHFGSVESLYAANRRQLEASGLLFPRQCDSLLDPIPRSPSSILRTMERENIKMIPILDPLYPKQLASIPDAPTVLFVKGEIPTGTMVSIVGSRRPTGYGLEMARRLAGTLSDSGCCIVSGMARGIDTAAHTGALEADAPTIAVLACGVDVVYPPENRSLADRIAQTGAILSEYPPGTAPYKHQFPVRNRIISGLSLGTIIVEAGERSGSLITAQCAAEQGRDVMAVPGNVLSRNSIGPNRLISEGARLVRDAADVLEELAWGTVSRSPVSALKANDRPDCRETFHGSEKERQIYEFLQSEPLDADAICQRMGASMQDVQVLLLNLELGGIVHKDFSGHYWIKEK